MLKDYAVAFFASGISAYAGITAILGFTSSDSDKVMNTIIAIMAGAVGVLWKRLDAHYKKVEKNFLESQITIKTLEAKVDECEKDRAAIKAELETLRSFIPIPQPQPESPFNG